METGYYQRRKTPTLSQKLNNPGLLLDKNGLYRAFKDQEAGRNAAIAEIRKAIKNLTIGQFCLKFRINSSRTILFLEDSTGQKLNNSTELRDLVTDA